MSVTSEASAVTIVKEPLSLSNFQAGYAKEPYLNTPRSLDACQIHGVNPVDLVEIPFREFRKSYPNDEEAALRRFERFDGVRKCLLDTVTQEWKRIAARGTLTGVVKTTRNPDEIVSIVDYAPGAYTPLLEIHAKELQKVEMQQYIGLKKMVVNQMNAAIQEGKSKQIIAKQEGISEQNEQMKRKRLLDRENILKEQREEAKYKEYLAAKEVRLEQQKAAIEARKNKERLKESEKAEKKRQQKREEDRLLQEAYLKKLKEDEKRKTDAIAHTKLKKFEADMREKERKDAAENEQRQLEQVRLRNEMIQKLDGAKKEAHRIAEEKRLAILNKIETSNRNAETAKEARERQQKEEMRIRDKALQDKINHIRGQGDKVMDEKVKRTLDSLERKFASSNREQNKNRAELERRQVIKKIKNDAFKQNLQRAQTAEAFRMKRIEEDLARKDAKARAIKESMAAFQAFRENLSETVSKTRGELKREAFKLSHQNRLNPDNLMDAVVDHTSSTLFPRLHHTFQPVGSKDKPKSPEAEQPGRPDSTSPHKDRDEHLDDRPRSPLARARYTLHDFAENRLTREMVESRESIERRNADLLLPYSITLGASRKNAAAQDKNALSRTVPSNGYSSDGVNGGNARPSTTGGENRSTILTPGNRFVNEDVVAEEDQDVYSHGEGGGEGGNNNGGEEFNNNDYDDYDGGQEEFEASEKRGASNVNSNNLDVTDDDNLFFQPVPSLAGSSSQKKKKSVINHKSKGKSSSRPVPVKSNEFRREFSKDHPLAPGGKGNYEADRAGGKKHPVGWVDGGKSEAEDMNSTGEISHQQQQPQYNKVVIHQTRNPQTDTTAVKDVATWQTEIDSMRRQQNQALLKLLEEERLAEEDRGKMGKLVKDHEERHRLELVFSEERKRASERIISLTRHHEMNIKDANCRLRGAGSA